MADTIEKRLSVVFDMDGVIFDSERLYLDSGKMVAARYPQYDIPALHEAILSSIGVTGEETRRLVLARCGEDFDYDDFMCKTGQMLRSMEADSGLPTKPGIFEILRFLKQKNAAIGLASSSRLAFVEQELKTAGLYEYFDVVVGGDLLKKSKPAPDIYLLACERLNAAPEEAYAIEDSYNGIRSAYAAGMKPIMVPDLLPPTEEMRKKCRHIAGSLLELIDYSW